MEMVRKYIGVSQYYRPLYTYTFTSTIVAPDDFFDLKKRKKELVGEYLRIHNFKKFSIAA